MTTLYAWTANRSGDSMTITHSAGRITGVHSIGLVDLAQPGHKGSRLLATTKDGRTFQLATAVK